jgi:uncharacterized protein DUF3168
MRLEECIMQQLRNYGPLVALVADRIHFAATYEQDATMPTVTFQRVSRIPEYTHSGETGFEDSRFQISAWGKTAMEAVRVAGTIKDALKPWTTAQTQFDGLLIGGVNLENEDGPLFHPFEFEPASVHEVMQDYRFFTAEG